MAGGACAQGLRSRGGGKPALTAFGVETTASNTCGSAQISKADVAFFSGQSRKSAVCDRLLKIKAGKRRRRVPESGPRGCCSMSEAAATRRRGRGGGGAARRAERTAVSIETAPSIIERNIPLFEVLNEEGARHHRTECRDRAGRDWRQLRRESQGAGALARGGRGCRWRTGAHSARPGAGADARPPPANTPSMPATPSAAMSSSAGATLSAPRSMARPSCATWTTAAAMRRWRISRSS